MTEIDIHGLTDEKTTGPYDDEDACKQTLHLTIAVMDEIDRLSIGGPESRHIDIYVPVTNVSRHAFDYHGDVPVSFDIDLLRNVDGVIHGEVYHDDGSVTELIPNYNEALGKFNGYDTWTLEHFEDPVESAYPVIWERE